MIRVTKMSGKFYGINLPSDDEKAIKEISEFTETGVPVILVDSISDLEDLGIYDVIMVERS